MFYLRKRQAVFLFLDVIAHVHAFEGMAFIGQSAFYGKAVDPFQVPDVQRNGIAP